MEFFMDDYRLVEVVLESLTEALNQLDIMGLDLEAIKVAESIDALNHRFFANNVGSLPSENVVSPMAL
tara:strand:+ start:473 stop:676 length:204 start_codon:yes stop_codon:yes gene_type:complete